MLNNSKIIDNIQQTVETYSKPSLINLVYRDHPNFDLIAKSFSLVTTCLNSENDVNFDFNLRNIV